MNPKSAVTKFAILGFLAIVISLYKAFVLMNLWNWFVVGAFHVSSISLLPMLGVVWFVGLITDHSDSDAEFFWGKAFALIGLCIPETKRDAAQDEIRRMDSEMWSHMWLGAGNKFFQATMILVLGFCVHAIA